MKRRATLLLILLTAAVTVSAAQIQLRRGTTTEWSTENPILASGEVGIDLTTGCWRIGDGSSTWSALTETCEGALVSVDAIADIDAAVRSGSDTTLITGTAGTDGNCVEWNADGDIVDAGAACGTGGSGDATSFRSVDLDSSVGTPSDGNILVYRSAGTDWVLEAKPAAGSNPACADITDGTTAGCNIVTAADPAAQRTALNVEDGATADQTGAEMESALDTELGNTTWKLDWTADQGASNIPAANVPEAATATALAANGANCSAGSFPLGVDASGAVESCTPTATVATTGSFADLTDEPVLPSQAEAQTGTATTARVWSAERVAQAISAQSTGTDDQDASEVTVTGTPDNYTPTAGTVQGHVEGIDDEFANLGSISTGTAAPATTPSTVGDMFIDTTNDNVYSATGTASSADWDLLNDGAGVSDGDKGDIVVSGSGATWSLDADVVAAAEMADADHGDVSWTSGVATVQAVNGSTTLELVFERTISDPTDDDDFMWFKAPAALTLTGIDCIAEGTTPSITVDLHECTSAGASCATVLSSVITANGGNDAGSISDDAVDDNDWMRWVSGAPTGTVDAVSCTLTATRAW